MSFGVSETYIYAYIAFAFVYLLASSTFVASALRVSTGLSKATKAAVHADATASPATSVIGHGQKIVDYTQLSTLLPLVYIVGSMFLGSVISRNVDLARTMNIAWVAFTVLCAAASVGLAALGIRESSVVHHASEQGLVAQSPEAVQRIGIRLSVSAALLLLVAVFTLLNLLSVLSSLEALSAADFLL